MDENTKFDGIELADEQLESMSGGLIVEIGGNGRNKYAAVDDTTGEIRFQEPTLQGAKARSYGWFDCSDEVISRDGFKKRFGMDLYDSFNRWEMTD